jgi:hypothetical protein
MSLGSKPTLWFFLDGLVWCWLVNTDRPQGRQKANPKDLARPEINPASPAHKTPRGVVEANKMVHGCGL